MHSGQWEQCFIMYPSFIDNIPSTGRMAPFTIRTQVSLVHIGMAVITGIPRYPELMNFFSGFPFMAFDTFQGLMDALKGKSGLGMMKLHGSPEWKPLFGIVAEFTFHGGQIHVRLIIRFHHSGLEKTEERQDDDRKNPGGQSMH